MNRRRRYTILLLTVAPVLVLLIAVIVFLTIQIRTVLSRLDVLLVDEISRQIGREARVGRVTASPLGTAVIYDLRVANGKTFAAGTLLDAKRVIVRYRWWDLIWGRVSPVESVDSVWIVRPRILLERFRTGKLNIQDLIAPRPGPPRPPFKGVVHIERGAVEFRDWLAKVSGPKPAVTRTAELRGTFDAADAPFFYVYYVSARGANGRLVDRFAISGSIDNRKSVLAVDLTARGAAAGYWSSYLFRSAAFEVKRGRADVRLSATGRLVSGRRVWSHVGTIDLYDGQAVVAGFRETAERVRGAIRFAGQIFNFNLTADMAATPLKFTGTVAGLVRPRLDLHVASNSADFARILRSAKVSLAPTQVQLGGRGPGSVNIIGPADDLVYVVRASIPAASVLGYRASGLNVRATYARGAAHVESASAEVLNGRVAVSGAVEVAGGAARLALAGSASNVQLGLIPQLREAGLRGAAAGRFVLTGTSSAPRLEADIQVSSGKFNKIAFRDAAASVVVTSSGVTIRSLAAGAASGVIRAAGDVTARRLDLRMDVTGADLGQLLRPFNVAGVSGIANLNGTVSGSLSNPVIGGGVEVFEGRYDRYGFDYARARLTAAGGEVRIEEAVVQVLPAELRMRGRIAGLGRPGPVVSLDVNVVEAPADRILAMLRTRANIAGTVNGSLTVRGPAQNVTARATLTLTDGAVSGYPITQARGDIAYANGVLKLTDLTAQTDGAVLSAEGMADLQGNLAFTFAANNISLVNLADLTKPYAVLSGTADISGRLAGTTGRPSLAASVAASRPTINTVPLDRVAAELLWNGTAVSVADLSVQAGEGQMVVLRGEYDFKSRTIDISEGSFTNFPVPVLYTAVVQSPYIDRLGETAARDLLTRIRPPQLGVLSGSFAAAGPVGRLQANAKLSFQDVTIGEIKNARIALEASSQRGQVLLQSFEAAAGSMNVSARGTLVTDGQTDLEVDAYNVDLASLAPAAGPLQITGAATVRTAIQGPLKSPLITASVEMENPEIYGIKFDRLRASQITVRRDLIDISRALLQKDVHSATFYGVVPWSWTDLSVPVDRPIDLHTRIENQTLGIVTILSDAITTDRENPGLLSATVDLTGTLASPKLNGRMSVVEGNIGIRNMLNTFTHLNASLVFAGDTVQVASLAGESSSGGRFEVVPGGTLSLKNLLIPAPGQSRGLMKLAVRADALAIAEQNLLGYNERVNGRFTAGDGGISITGPVTSPVISGRVEIADAAALLSAVPAERARKPIRYVLNPAFDVRFVLGDRVWFRNPGLIALMQGGGELGGTLNRPVVRADLRIARGQIALPTQRMRITSGTVKVDWSPSETGQAAAPRVVVDIRAQTSVMATSPAGTRRRYTIVMTVQGPLDNLQPENVNLRSEPAGLSRPQILAALGHFEDIYGGGELALRQQFKDLFTVAVTPLVFSRLESAFVEALGLEEFNIEYGFEQPLSLFVSGKVLGSFYLSYWQIITGAPTITGATYSLRLSYRLRDWLDVGYATDSRRVGVFEASYGYRF